MLSSFGDEVAKTPVFCRPSQQNDMAISHWKRSGVDQHTRRTIGELFLDQISASTVCKIAGCDIARRFHCVHQVVFRKGDQAMCNQKHKEFKQFLLAKILMQEHLTAPLETERDQYYPEYASSSLQCDSGELELLFRRRIHKLRRFTERQLSEWIDQKQSGKPAQGHMEEMRQVCSALFERLEQNRAALFARPHPDSCDFGEWIAETAG